MKYAFLILGVVFWLIFAWTMEYHRNLMTWIYLFNSLWFLAHFLFNQNMMNQQNQNKLTTVVNIKRTNVYDVYCGRPGKGIEGPYGNPFRIKQNETRGSTLDKYKNWFDFMIENDEEFKSNIMKLHGKVLGCFCKPNSCHADIIANWLNTQQL